jgi:hypothetical protein
MDGLNRSADSREWHNPMEKQEGKAYVEIPENTLQRNEENARFLFSEETVHGLNPVDIERSFVQLPDRHG